MPRIIQSVYQTTLSQREAYVHPSEGKGKGDASTTDPSSRSCNPDAGDCRPAAPLFCAARGDAPKAPRAKRAIQTHHPCPTEAHCERPLEDPVPVRHWAGAF